MKKTLHQGPRRSRPAADQYGEGLTGIPPLEAEASNQDILPDQVYRRGAEPDEGEITARPSQPPRAIPPEELPEG